MRARLLVGYLSLLAAVLLVLEVPLGLSFAHRERDNLSQAVQRDAAAMAALSDEGLERPGSVDLAAVASRYRSRTGSNVSIVDGSGRIVVSLHPSDPEADEPQLRRRLQAALGGHPLPGSVTFSDEGVPTVATIASVGATDHPRGAVVMTSPESDVLGRIRRTWAELAVFGLAVLAAAAAVGLGLARSVTSPLRHLEETAEELGAGDLAVRADTGRGPAEVRALAQEFNRMASRLEELVDAQRVFVADASHQLRTPLTALRLRLENLAAQVPPEAAGDVAAAAQESRRLARIVDGLLALARAERVRPAREPIDVLHVVRERCAAWGPLADERGVRLEVADSNPRRAVAWVVPGHLEQMLDNLLDNAVEATPEGSSVSMNVATRNGAVMVHVVDQGGGLSTDERAHAFDRFWQGQAGSGSSGLGLAIVRRLARGSDGDVELSAAPGGGLDAVLRLQSV